MNDEEVKSRLEKMCAKRGKVAMVAREAEIDARTLRSVMRGDRESNEGTIKKLVAYFKKLDRQAAKAQQEPASQGQ